MSDSRNRAPRAADQAGRGEPLTLDVNDARWREMLGIDAELALRTGIRLLTPEARILFHLMTSGPMSVTTAMQVAGVSYRGFYAVMERLKKVGFIVSTKNQEDQRVRTLAIDFPVPMPSAAE